MNFKNAMYLQMQTHYGWMMSICFTKPEHLHPVEIFSYTAWTWHGIFRFAYAVEVETFLNTWLLGVKLIRNVWQETSSFNAEKKKERMGYCLRNLKKNPNLLC